jgi:hypothetical protein
VLRADLSLEWNSWRLTTSEWVQSFEKSSLHRRIEILFVLHDAVDLIPSVLLCVFEPGFDVAGEKVRIE